MAKRYNLCVPRSKSDGGTWWQQVGTLFEKDDGTMNMKLDAVPVGMINGPNGEEPWGGWIKVFPQDADRGGGQRPGAGGNQRSGGGSNYGARGGQGAQQRSTTVADLDDEIPF